MTDLAFGTICYLTPMGEIVTVIKEISNEPGWFCCRSEWMESPGMMLIHRDNLKPVASLSKEQANVLFKTIYGILPKQ